MKDSKSISITKAAIINASAKYITVILQLVYTAILSRILSPTDYGTVAVVNVFIVFFHLLSDMGFGSGVIQNKELTSEDIANIFSFTVYLGVCLLLAFDVFSFFIAWFYGDEIYISLGMILSFSLMFNAFNVIPNALMLKEKRFLAIAVRTIVIAILSFSLTIFIALQGLGVYALTFYSVLNAALLFAWNKASTKVRFMFKCNFQSVQKIWSYSMYQFGAQALNYFNRNLDNLMIGKLFNKTDLGYYDKAYTLMRYPITYLPGVITPVLHPILSEHQTDKGYIYKKYLVIVRILSLLGCVGSVFCFYAGKEIIMISFGGQWEMSVMPFRILSLSLWPQIINNTIAPIYQSIGNTKLMFKSLIITTCTTVIMIIIGVFSHDIDKVALCVSAAYVINFFITYYILVVKGFGMNYFAFLKGFKIEILIFAVLIIEAMIVQIKINNHALCFLCKFFLIFSSYAILLLITGQYKILKAMHT